jgi:hypothetical protein
MVVGHRGVNTGRQGEQAVPKLLDDYFWAEFRVREFAGCCL